ncbi:MAG TPA: ABC transporter permease [Rhodothermales bacterium]|nr:ABC transporter permease [Rhodothermales bacterium]
MTQLSDTYHLLQRHVRETIRIPIWIFVSLVQPIIWLALYGQLFRRIVEIPGFQATSYIQFLTPGVVVMTALFGSLWAGMGLIQDIDAGVLDRLLATPVNRTALVAARVLHSTLTVTVQSVIILLMGFLLGASLPGRVGGFLAIILISALLSAGIGCFSVCVALLARREETLIAIVNFFGLPLTFLSTAFMARALMPGWIQAIARANPIDWAVVACRDAMLGQHWGSVWLYCTLLLVFVLIGAFAATQAFRAYRRSS